MPQHKVLASAMFREFYPFDKLFARGRTIFRAEDLKGADALVIWGGEDISPALYNQMPYSERWCGPLTPSYRDRVEADLAKAAMEQGIPIIGICRGAQLMCALSGGALFQHTTGHTGRQHTLQLDNGEEIVSNSLHHQMMDLRKVDHKLIGWIPEPLSEKYFQENGEVPGPEKEPEIAWLPKAKALCIQGHPEYLSPTAPFTKYCCELVEQYCLK